MKRTLAFLLSFGMLLAGCNAKQPASSQEPAPSEEPSSSESQSQTPEDFEQKRMELLNANADFAGLTLEQKMEDYEYFWKILREGYPYWGVVKRAGLDADAVYQKGKDYLESNQTDLDFNSILFQITRSDFGGTGHLASFASAAGYQALLDVYGSIQDENPRWNRVVQILENPATKIYYDNMQEVEEKIAALQEEEKNEPEEAADAAANASTQILEEGKIAYIRIPSFADQYVDSDRQLLLDFYKEIAEYPHLILDLTGNGGGNDEYWENNIVVPNISAPLTSHQYFLFNSKAECNQDYLPLTFEPESIHPISELPEMPKLAEEDLPLFDSFVYSERMVEPESGAKPFQGKIWVLVDEWVYSSSESFALFCKDTGFATLVGVNTGGDGGGPEGNFFTLPNSGLLIQFSVFFSLNPDGSGNEEYGTTPDILSPDGETPLDTCLKAIRAL